MMTNLLVDTNNVVMSLRHSLIKPAKTLRQKQRFVKETLFIAAIGSIFRTAKKVHANAIVMVCDSKNVWRRDIFPQYKCDRTVKAVEDVYHEDAKNAADMVADFFREYTNAFVLKTPRCEADDIIGIWCRDSYGVRNVIMSTDTDYRQLLDERTYLFSPTKYDFVECEDPEYALFLKCVRGDSTDKIPSAYKGVRETLIKKAWEEPLEMVNFLETVVDGETVGKRIDLNAQLIDLYEQPEEIKNDIYRTILSAIDTPEKTVSPVSMMRFFGKNALKESTSLIDDHLHLLKKKPVFETE